MKNNFTNYIFPTLSFILVFLFFSHTLNYPWRDFDENIIFNETILPVPKSLSEMFLYIKHLGTTNHLEASNPFYTTISNLRGTPLDVIFSFFIFLLFQKNPFNYHLFSLLIHCTNTALFFLILTKLFKTKKNILYLLLSLIWALHPVNVESVLFGSNYGALITYFFCFLIFYIFIDVTESKISLKENILIFLTYLFPLFLNEYSVTLPIIIGGYLFTKNLSLKKSFKESLISSIKLISPMIFAFFIFLIYHLSFPTVRTYQDSNMLVLLERIFWLSPQVFIHAIKLTFYPNILSIDQSAHVTFGNNIFTSYSIMCSTIMFSLIVLSFIFLFKLKEKKYYIFSITFFLFFFSLLPFLHIVSPIYNIFSERYLYLPLFFLVFGIAHLLESKKHIIGILIFILLILSTKSYFRTLDWKDSYSLYESAYKTAPNDFFKGLRLIMMGAEKISHQKDQADIYYGQKNISSGYLIIQKYLNSLKEKNQIKILSAYGLDIKTKKAKAAYILAFTRMAIDGNSKEALNILLPHLENLKIIDTQILDFYCNLLKLNNIFFQCEDALKTTIEKRLSPTVLINLSELYESKYKNINNAELLLNKAFKLFPYNPLTLIALRNFYLRNNNLNKLAHYTFLYGLRTHSKSEIESSILIYKNLNDKVNEEKIRKALKELKY